jgi:nucleoside-diphosphate-sugar epimerase
MSNAILGAEGFLGKAIMNYARKFWACEEWIGITRDNYDRWKHYHFGKIIWSAGSASKELCSNWETAKQVNTDAVQAAIKDFPCDKFIYISSQAVYPDGIICSSEEALVDKSKLSNYGKSKYLGELVVKENALKYVVVRPNGFTGPGLKKNAVFYMGQSKPLLYYTWDSYAQYLHVDTFADILLHLAYYYENETFNVTSPDTIDMYGIAALLGVNPHQVEPFRDPLPVVKARITTSKMFYALETSNYSKVLLDTITSMRAVEHWRHSLYCYPREKATENSV